MDVRKYRHYGTVVVVVLSVIPIYLWLREADTSAFTASDGNFLAAIGKGAALSGLVLYSLVPILSMRHRAILFVFGGLDKVYKLHKSAAKVSFFLILAHPLLLGIGQLLNGLSITSVWDWSGLLIVTGAIGIVGMIIVMGFSVYAHVSHQQWVRVHRFLGWFLVIFYIHALLANNQVANNFPLTVYMLFMGTLGVIAFLYRSVVGNFFIKRYHYEIAEVVNAAPSVTELVLKPTGIPITYTPGQFAYLSFQSGAVDSEPHPFSFTTAPNGPYVRFAIKALGDDTMLMKQLQKGTKALLEGPYGDFSYTSTKNKEQVWIAGGVGITPFLSMARSLTQRSAYKIHLFYAADKLTDAAFLKELIAIRKTIPDNFTVTTVNRDLSGFVSGDLISKEIKDPVLPDYFLCGPPIMIKTLHPQILQLGIPDDRIHIEEFSMK